MEEEIARIWIQEEESGERLDKILAQRFSEISSRSYFQMLIDEQLVLVNGSPVKKRIKPCVGDEVEIQFALTPEIDLVAEAIPLDILYEDDSLLVINKPVGMVVHPAPGHWNGTFVNALLHHCHHLAIEDNSLRPGIVHRLDKDTSGVLVAAKTTTIHQRLSAMFAGREVYKEYLTVCVGNPGDVEISAPIQRHPVHRQQMTVVPEGGKPAMTTCKTLATDGKLSIVRAIIATGRTHQIRVHMKHLRTPVLGDPIYGNLQMNKKYGASRQMLHAAVLRFAHPIHHQEMEFRAPVPNDMQSILRNINPLHPMRTI